jgi:hypothetical protein
MLPQAESTETAKTEDAAISLRDVIFIRTPKLLNNLYAGLGCVGFKQIQRKSKKPQKALSS